MTQEPLQVQPHGTPGLDYKDYQKRKTDSKIEWFFTEKVSTILLRFKYLLILIGTALFAWNIWGTMRIKVRNLPEGILKESHPLSKAIVWGKQEIFLDRAYFFYMYFGLKDDIWVDPDQPVWQAQT